MSFGGDKGPSRAERDAAKQQADYIKQQNELAKRQEVELQQRNKQAQKEQIAALRGRFGLAGGITSGSSDSSLYNRITGR